MNMQDKELDELFRTGLAGWEAEPSAQVWQNIDAELNGQQKKPVLAWLRVAASVTVILATGTWLLLGQSAPSNQAASHPYAAHVQAGSANIEPTQTIKSAAVVQSVQPQSINVHTAYTTVKQSDKAISHAALKVNKPSAKPAEAITANQPVEVLAAAAVAPKDRMITPVLPEVPLTVKTLTDEPSAFRPAIMPVVAAVALPQSAKKHKHGIRSLGDIINVVVAQIDKREDKIIEFSDTDDDNADVTGINLGLVKIKKDK